MKLHRPLSSHQHSGLFSACQLALLSAPALHAAEITSAQNGPYSDIGTWMGGSVPGDGDTAVINHSVTIATGDGSTNLTDLITINASLRVDNSMTFEDITLDNGGTINSHNGNDTITIDTLTIAAGGGTFRDRNNRHNNGLAPTTIVGTGDLTFSNHNGNSTQLLFINCNDMTGYTGTLNVGGLLRTGSVDLTQDIDTSAASFNLNLSLIHI
mgnify:CR=1 FL=1